MAPTIRIVLSLVALLVGTALAVTHGLRGMAVLVVVTLAVTVPRTRGWRLARAWALRLTGSGRRAAVLLGLVILAGVITFEVIELVR